MAFQLTPGDNTIAWKVELTGGPLSCFDTLGDPDFDMDRDFLLHRRSALELVRDQLSDAQRAELDQVDAHWRENAEAFNADFALDHNQEELETALEGFVQDGRGETPRVPQTHWWWRPIEVREAASNA